MLATRLGRPRPVYAHYGVTHRCNMRCRMCAVWKSADRDAELAVEQVAQLAGSLHAAGVRTMAIGGGEPFVRTDLAEVISAFTDKSMEVRLLTNGIGLSDERIGAAISAGISHVSISLDSVDPDKERYIYDGHDVWDDIVHAMRRFRSGLASARAVPVMNVCVSRLNIDELPLLVDMAVRERYFCSFVPVTLSTDEESSDGFAGIAPDLAVREEDYRGLEQSYTRLLQLKRAGAPIVNSSRFLRDSLEYLKTGKTNWKCDAGQLYLSVNPEGGISMCHRYPPVAGADTQDLASVLKNREVRLAAERSRAACLGCMRPCWAEVTHAMHGLRSGFEAWKVFRRYKVPAYRHVGESSDYHIRESAS